MRKCHICQTDMIEDATLHMAAKLGCMELRGATGDFGLFDGFTLKAAVCPNCGEVSLYLEDFKEFVEKTNKKEEYFF